MVQKHQAIHGLTPKIRRESGLVQLHQEIRHTSKPRQSNYTKDTIYTPKSESRQKPSSSKIQVKHYILQDSDSH